MSVLSRAAPAEWVPTRGFPVVVYPMFAGGPILTAVVAYFVLTTPALVATIGLLGWIAVFGAVLVFSLGLSFLQVGTFRPKAVRATHAGIEILPMIGAPRTMAWEAVRVGPVLGRFQVLQSRSGPGGSVAITAEQWLTVRSSPHRPAGWSVPLPGGS